VIKNRIGVQVVTSRANYLYGLLTSLRCQTIQNWDLFLVYQDASIVNDPTIRATLQRLEFEGHRIKLLPTQVRGIGNLRNIALRECDTDVGIRIDDDSICDKTYFEKLYEVLKRKTKDVGAVGGAVPFYGVEKVYNPPKEKYGIITESGIVVPDQVYFYNQDGCYPADHLQSAYMYYNDVMRKVWFPTIFDHVAGFREETLPLVKLSAMGYKHWFVPKAICWHNQAETGGVRDEWKRVGWEGKILADDIFIREYRKIKCL
jgi:hypothetical protein